VKRPQRLVNVTQVRKYALDFAQKIARGDAFSRISSEFYDHLEVLIRKSIRASVERHPSKWQTLKP